MTAGQRRGLRRAPGRWRALLPLILLGTAGRASAGPAAPAAVPEVQPAARGPRVGLALSGGGARGIAHIGVLRALEEKGVIVDYVGGTSMGAVIGALYASGYSPDRLADIVRSVDWQEVFSGKPKRSLVPLSHRVDERSPVLRVGFDFWRIRLPPATASDYRINRFLSRHLAGPGFRAERDFDRLPIPFRAVAADLQTGERVVLSAGSLERAVRASMSTPVTLLPVSRGDRQLVDGGVVDNIPVGVVRAMGAETIIAVDVTSPLLNPDQYESAFGVGAQLLDVLARARNASFRQAADLTIRPDLGGHTNSDYSHFEDLMARAYQGGVQALAGLPDRSGGTPLAASRPPGTGSNELEGSRIAEVRVDGNRHVRERLIVKALGLEPGVPLRLGEALRGLDAVYATRLFESCWLDFEAAEGAGVVVVVHVREADRRTVELGAAYNEGDKAMGFLRLLNRNLFGRGERVQLLGLASDAGQGLEGGLWGDRLLGSPLGYLARVRLFEEKPRFFRDHESLGRAEFDREEAVLGLQRQAGPALLIRAALGAGRVRTRPRPGLDFEARSDRVRILRGAAIWDRLDDPHFPTGGKSVSFMGERSLPSLGASLDYWRALVRGQAAISIGRSGVLEARLLAGASGGAVPPYELFRLGGPVWIPGLHRDELWGRQAAAVGISHSFVLKGGLRLTARAAAGNVWDTRREVSIRSARKGIGVGLGLPTRIGPISVDWGRSDASDSRFHFAIGFQ